MPGPNAPLYDGCKNSRQPLANADEAVKSWNAAGFPLKKIMLGTAFYGYISRSDSTKLYTKRSGSYDLSNSVAKRSWGSRLASDDLATTNTHNELEKRAVTVKNEGGGSNDGQIMFVDLIRQGALGWDNNQRKWVGANGFTRMWDGCSSTVSPLPKDHHAVAFRARSDPPFLAALPSVAGSPPSRHLRRPRLAFTQGPICPPEGPWRCRLLGSSRRQPSLGPPHRPPERLGHLSRSCLSLSSVVPSISESPTFVLLLVGPLPPCPVCPHFLQSTLDNPIYDARYEPWVADLPAKSWIAVPGTPANARSSELWSELHASIQ